MHVQWAKVNQSIGNGMDSVFVPGLYLAAILANN